MLTELIGVLANELTPFEAGLKRSFPHHNEPEDQLSSPEEGGSAPDTRRD